MAQFLGGLTSVPTSAKLLEAFGGAFLGVVSQNDRRAAGWGSILIALASFPVTQKGDVPVTRTPDDVGLDQGMMFLGIRPRETTFAWTLRNLTANDRRDISVPRFSSVNLGVAS